MSDLKQYNQLKEQVEAAQRKADKAQGALDTTMERLKKEFGCSTISAAKKKLATLDKKEKNLKEEMDEAIEDFEEKWEAE